MENNPMGKEMGIAEIRKIRQRIHEAEEKGEKNPDYGLIRLIKALKKSEDFLASSMTRGGHRCTR